MILSKLLVKQLKIMMLEVWRKCEIYELIPKVCYNLKWDECNKNIFIYLHLDVNFHLLVFDAWNEYFKGKTENELAKFYRKKCSPGFQLNFKNFWTEKKFNTRVFL